MYKKQIRLAQYEAVTRGLTRHARREALDAAHYCDIQVNHIHYRLRLQKFEHRWIIPLQAQRLDHSARPCEVITDSLLLGALTELLVAQYCRDFTAPTI